MKPIERGEMLGLADYEAIRERFRARVIDEKKLRRVALGPKATRASSRTTTRCSCRSRRCCAPSASRASRDRSTRSRRTTSSSPATDELSCTVMIEIADKDERDAFLRRRARLRAARVARRGRGPRAGPRARPGERPKDRTTAVHYLKFTLPAEIATALRASGPEAPSLGLEVDHPAYGARVTLPQETVHELREDLRDPT